MRTFLLIVFVYEIMQGMGQLLLVGGMEKGGARAGRFIGGTIALALSIWAACLLWGPR